MVTPVPAIVTCVGTALLIGILTGGANSVGVIEIPDCGSLLDVVTGCDNAVSRFIAYVVLGTIPGAHAVVNAFMGVLGIGLRATAIQYFLDWIRGKGS